MAIERDDQDQANPVSRRGFLTGFGAGAAAAAGAVVLPPTDALAFEDRPPATRPDRFSRLFPNLRPFADASNVTEALKLVGALGGPLDAKDPLHEGPIRLITVPDLSPNNLDNSVQNQTAGTTFFGQFLDHDMTFDAASPLGVATDPAKSPNSRDPRFNLDTVYGGGPTVTPQLYVDKTKFIVENGGLFEDLPRMKNGTAVIGDPRNDENLMIAGLQVAFLKFHNRVVDLVRDDRDRHRSGRDSEGDVFRPDTHEHDPHDDRGESTFDEARRIVTWHYQWIIVNEFLPQIIGRSLVDDILRNGRRFYNPRPGEQSIPVEFQLAYRFGHSLIRPSYRANLFGDPNGLETSGAPAFFGFIFDPAGQGQADPVDLRGGARADRRFIGWQTFFDFGNIERPRAVGGAFGPLSQDVRPNKIIDTHISTPLFQLPLGAIAGGVEGTPISLATRNLLRHLTWSVPSGQSLAREMRIAELSSSHFKTDPNLEKYGVGLERSTPLWIYILKEAEVMNAGARLAGAGARLIGEVFLGLLKLDRNSYFNASTRNRGGWKPTLPARVRDTFGMVDLLRFAKVDPTSRGQ